MAGMSSYLKAQYLNQTFRSGTFQKPATLAVCLLVAPISSYEDGSLAGREVPDANNYQRVEVEPSDDNWSAPTPEGEIRNRVIIRFPVASGTWGSIVAVAITDNPEYGQGNLLCYGLMNTPQTVTAQMQFEFNIADISIQVM